MGIGIKGSARVEAGLLEPGHESSNEIASRGRWRQETPLAVRRSQKKEAKIERKNGKFLIGQNYETKFSWQNIIIINIFVPLPTKDAFVILLRYDEGLRP